VTVPPANGSLVFNPDGSYTYTPNANYNGTDNFIYKLCDVNNDCDTAIVKLTVTPFNDTPLAVVDYKTTLEDTPVTSTVATNDIPSGDGGNVWSVTVPPANGSLVFNPDGSYTYTPNANYNGTDNFIYKLV